MEQFKLFENLEIEQAVIGRALAGGAENIALDEEDFSLREHWLIFKSIQDGCDLKDFIKTGQENYEYVRGCFEQYGLAPLRGQEEYEQVLKELSRKRKMYNAMRTGIDMLDTNDSSEVLSFINKMIQENAQSRMKSCDEIRKQILRRIDEPREYDPTGIKCLDNSMGGGLYRGFTYGICGKEKAGKTTLGHTISAQIQCKHAYIAMEMGSEQIEQKNLARQINHNSLAFLQKPKELKNSIETAQKNEFIYYYDAIGETLDQILHAVNMGILKHGLQGFIVDYWQLIQPSEKTNTEEKHLRDVAQGLANFARKKNIWCVVLAQLNKDGQLFGGNGLRKACDQLYMIEECTVSDRARWIKQDATRYTIKADIGDEENPALYMDVNRGPYFYDASA